MEKKDLSEMSKNISVIQGDLLRFFASAENYQILSEMFWFLREVAISEKVETHPFFDIKGNLFQITKIPADVLNNANTVLYTRLMEDKKELERRIRLALDTMMQILITTDIKIKKEYK